MNPSTLAKIIRERLNCLVTVNIDSNYGLGRTNHVTVRRTIGLTLFNIMKYDSLILEELSDLAELVSLESWPLIDLPSSKLEGNLQNYFHI